MPAQNLLNKADTYSLRGICMIMIITGHIYLSAIAPGGCGIRPTALNLLSFGNWGYWGTGIFFFLSGFGMFFSLQRHMPLKKDYLGKKLLKLIEPFLLMWAVNIVVFILFDPSQLTLHLLKEFLTLGIHPDIDAWFFKVILGLYLLIFFVFKMPLGNNLKVAIVFVCVIAYFIIMQRLHFGSWWTDSILNFPLGMLIALNFERIKKWPPFAILLPALAVFFGAHFFLPLRPIMGICFSLIAVSIIVYVPINHKILDFIGINSMFFYLLECPTMDYLAVFANSDFITYTFVTLLITMVLTYAYLKLKANIVNRENTR